MMSVGILGFHLAGKRVWWAWYVNLANQVVWATYGLITGLWAFTLSALFYGFVFSNNAIKWTKNHRQKEKIKKEFMRKVNDPLGTITVLERDEHGVRAEGTVHERAMNLLKEELDAKVLYGEGMDPRCNGSLGCRFPFHARECPEFVSLP